MSLFCWSACTELSVLADQPACLSARLLYPTVCLYVCLSAFLSAFQSVWILCLPCFLWKATSQRENIPPQRKVVIAPPGFRCRRSSSWWIQQRRPAQDLTILLWLLWPWCLRFLLVILWCLSVSHGRLPFRIMAEWNGADQGFIGLRKSTINCAINR